MAVDVYGQDFAERNSIVELPDGYIENAGNTLYSWLGSLWHTIHQGDDMVRGLQKARGIRLAQLYLNLLEAAKLQDRNGAPVFHRELWHPIVIRKSQRDKAQANLLLMGDDAQMGPQTEEEPYGVGTVLKMGRYGRYANCVTYPITADIKSMSTVIVDNIINPTVQMEWEKHDFEFHDNTIIFPKENDPLAEGSPFDKVDVSDFVEGEPDVEVVLWASDVLIDKNYIAEHLSYPLGANAPSSDVVKRIINAAWSSVASGLTPELVRTFIAAMLNIPVVQHNGEVVVDINVSDDAQEVYTDKGVYLVSPKAKLRKGLQIGSKLDKGDLLDESLRVYPFLNGVNWSGGGDVTSTISVKDDGYGNSTPVSFDDILADVPQYYNTTPVGTPSGANQTYLFFRSQGFGMSAGQKITSLVFTTAGGVSYNKLYARIWSYSGTVSNPKGELIAVSEEVVWDAGSGSAHEFVFPDGIVIPAVDSYYILDFSSSPNGETIGTFRILCYNYSPARNPDCYWGSSILVPVLTVEFSDSADESSSASYESSGCSESSGSTPGEMVILYKDTGFSIPLEQDIPSIVLSPDILRVRTKYGVYAMWGESVVKASESEPSHLYFDIGGTESDKSAFWQDVWKQADKAGVNMSKLIGREGDIVSPAAFFLRHFVGANTLFVVVDAAQLEDTSLLREPMFFGMLSSVVPSAIRLFIVEHRTVGEDDKMNLGSAQESTFLAAALPNIREDVVAKDVPGLKVPGASFEDSVTMRFIRSAPSKVRVRKEED